MRSASWPPPLPPSPAGLGPASPASPLSHSPGQQGCTTRLLGGTPPTAWQSGRALRVRSSCVVRGGAWRQMQLSQVRSMPTKFCIACLLVYPKPSLTNISSPARKALSSALPSFSSHQPPLEQRPSKCINLASHCTNKLFCGKLFEHPISSAAGIANETPLTRTILSRMPNAGVSFDLQKSTKNLPSKPPCKLLNRDAGFSFLVEKQSAATAGFCFIKPEGGKTSLRPASVELW
jgi:hypothetical protein